MDAIKFVETLQRKYKIENENKIVIHVDEDANFLVNFIEEWSKEHPVKTRQSEFLKQYSEAQLFEGVVNIPPCRAVKSFRPVAGCEKTDCLECRREFWMQEVE